MTKAKPVTMISLRCPGCRAQVNVEPGKAVARCFLCGTHWNWSRGSAVAFALLPVIGGRT